VNPFELTAPLETERLQLRAFAPEDLDAVHAMQSRPDVARYLYWEPRTETEARRSLEMKVESRAIRADGDTLSVAAVLRSTGALIGDCNLTLLSTEHGQGEIGFVVHPDHQGHGYATEAARRLLRVAFEDVGLHRVVGRLEARNAPSARVLEKLGMRREAHLVENEWVKGEWQSEVVLAILDREWRETSGGRA
jgi:RimJ/RimL family protein N-acetyltransferase